MWLPAPEHGAQAGMPWSIEHWKLAAGFAMFGGTPNCAGTLNVHVGLGLSVRPGPLSIWVSGAAASVSISVASTALLTCVQSAATIPLVPVKLVHAWRSALASAP